MKEIPLTQGYVALVDDGDYDKVIQHKWCVNINPRKTGPPRIYAVSNLPLPRGKQKDIKMHRIILGVEDRAVFVDHRDGDGLNNQRDNLRIATRAQNARNKRQLGKWGFKGVEMLPCGTWRARIMFERKATRIGYYKTAEEAARAYDRKAIELFREFAFTNFPREEYEQLPQAA